MPDIPWAVHHHRLLEAIQAVERLRVEVKDATVALPVEIYRGEDEAISWRVKDPCAFARWWAIQQRSFNVQEVLKSLLTLITAELQAKIDATPRCPTCKNTRQVLLEASRVGDIANVVIGPCPTCHGQPCGTRELDA